MVEEVSDQIIRKVETTSNRNIVFKTALTGILTAVETVATMIIAIAIPASEGYFNVGEGIIYFTAILFGPIIGAFVGGVGAALADLLLGYAIYAPATLVAKGIEGYVVGSLFLLFKKKNWNTNQWRIFSTVLGILVGTIVISLGYVFTEGDLLIGIYPGNISLWEITISNVNISFWPIMGILLMVFIIIMGWTIQPDMGQKVFAMIAGGICMVLGYLLYQSFLKGPAIAILEVPFNILQLCLGIFIAILIIPPIEKIIGSNPD